MILTADIAELFLLSDYIAKDRAKALIYLEFLYEYICVSSRAKFGGSNVYSMGGHICETIGRIRQNASAGLAVQALLIRLQEAYNAENSRDSI